MCLECLRAGIETQDFVAIVPIPLIMMVNDILFRKMFVFSKTSGLTVFTEYIKH